ncbi:protocadherin-8-like [Alosa alosa]|uniref:protocadherin-8-like n=1 Tax=Alosa alosa TaxID=278164 RepID=UPI0020154C19|nr:protocadherin-8-like [Alosa alosa]
MSVSFVLLLALSAVGGTTTKYYTYEEDAVGTFIGNLSEDLKIDPAEDPDTSFRFMQETNSTLIHMRATDGLLTVGDRIDRESLCQRSPRCLITFDVVVFFKEKFLLIHVEIHVKDINDNSPEFQRNTTDMEISENVPVGTRFPLDAAVDLDVGNNYIQTYQLLLNNHFGIEVRHTEDGAKFPELILLKALDREVEENYTLKVSATDGGSPPKSGSMTVNVKVMDYNDNSPIFEHDTLKVEFPEDAPAGFLLLKVHASDPDQGPNGEVRYDFAEGCQEESKGTFQIDPITGAVTLKSLVDFETKRSYELNIQAYDMGLNSIPSTCKVMIEVVDVNDNPPEINIKPMTSMSDGVAYITEAAAVESFVALISTSDRDSGENGYVRVSLNGHEHFKLQQAYGNSLMVVTTATLDREKIPEYNLTFEAEDTGSPPFKTLKQYTVRVRDENDNSPTFSKSVYEISVMENKAPGTYIATVVARDPDAGENGKVTYKLIDGESPGGAPLSSFVSVDPLSGSLHTVSAFNYESVQQFDVPIEATDGGSPQMSSTAVVRIKVLDQNDNAPFIIYPVLLNDSANVPIPYNAPAGYLALRIKARDPDEGMNGELTYRLAEDKQHVFSVSKLSGELVLKYGLSFALGEVLEVKIVVTDSGRSPLSCIATVRFVVTDMAINEEPILVLLQSHEDSAEEPEVMDASLVIIILLAVGCALLLVAIMTVALSRRCCQRDRPLDPKKGFSGGLIRRMPLPGHSIDSGESDTYMSTQSSTVNEQLSSVSTQDDSYDEQSTDSNNKVFRPLLSKSHFESVAVWQGDRFTSQISGTGSTDQTSVKDSGKGDSDFNDSDSDMSGEAARKAPCNIQPQANSSFYTGPVDRFGQLYEIPTYSSSSHMTNGGYTIAFSRASAYGPMHAADPQVPVWREYGYHTRLPKVAAHHHGQRPAPLCHRTGTLPTHFNNHQYDFGAQLEQQEFHYAPNELPELAIQPQTSFLGAEQALPQTSF